MSNGRSKWLLVSPICFEWLLVFRVFVSGVVVDVAAFFYSGVVVGVPSKLIKCLLLLDLA
jgi:hypothetical protein